MARRSNVVRMRRRPTRLGLGRRSGGLLLVVLLAGLWLLGQAPSLDWLPGGLGGPRTAVQGAVTHVRDGDTIEVAGVPVRIANLDCAELETAEGQAASARMRELVAGETVACELEGRMSYDREIATCALAASREDLGELLIGEGACGRWRGR